MRTCLAAAWGWLVVIKEIIRRRRSSQLDACSQVTVLSPRCEIGSKNGIGGTANIGGVVVQFYVILE